MIALTHFAGTAADFEPRAAAALAALAARPGYLRGTLGRCTDDPAAWLLLTEWRDVGSYRRALGDYQVKLHATPLLAEALDIPGGFEDLLDIAADGVRTVHSSDLLDG